MAEHPIIFSAPMVRALLREIVEPGTGKTQTRRLAWRDNGKPSPWQKVQPGDVLWVRENFAYVGSCDPGFLLHAADWQQTVKWLGLENAEQEPRWTPSIHMPRRAARIFLDVTAVKVERLQDISEENARAEGLDWVAPIWGFGDIATTWCGSPRGAFAALWNYLHGADAWGSNPEVVAITFKPRHKEPTQ